jgi:hypothetical protein
MSASKAATNGLRALAYQLASPTMFNRLNDDVIATGLNCAFGRSLIDAKVHCWLVSMYETDYPSASFIHVHCWNCAAQRTSLWLHDRHGTRRHAT